MSGHRFIFLFLLFFIDVRVRASAVSDSAASECLPRAQGCLLKSVRKPKHFQLSGHEMSLGRGGLAQIVSPERLRLVQGELYLQCAKSTKQKKETAAIGSSPMNVETSFGQVWCGEVCQMLVMRRENILELRALSGGVFFRRKGDATVFRLPPGQGVTVRPVESDTGQAALDIPYSLPWKSTVSLWAQLFPGNFSEFKKRVEEFREHWHLQVEALTDEHVVSVRRTLAAHEAEVARQKAGERARAAEDAKLRQLFREKNYFNP